METAQIEFHLCSSCERVISPLKPRYHCMSCVNYDLCAQCHSEGQPSQGHTEDHTLYQLFQVGISQDGFPLVGGGTALQYAPGEPNPFWGRMVTEGNRPSDLFRRLIDSIHHYISGARGPGSGYFGPEEASYIMVLLGYHEQDNIFHLFLTNSTQNPRGLAWSDEQTRRIYEHCGWDYQQGTRSYDQQIASVPAEHQQTFTPDDGGMPLLTRAGLRAMIIMEALADPQGFYQRFNHLLSVTNTSQTPLMDLEDGFRFPVGAIEPNCWPISPDREAVATRSRMWETANNAIETNPHPLFVHT